MHIYFRLMAAIFDFAFTPTSESIYNGPTVLLDPEIVKDTVGFSLPATVQDLHSELHVFPVSHSQFWFPVQHSWILAQCDIVGSSGDFDDLGN